MKVRKQFMNLPEEVSCTEVIDPVSMTQPEMSLSIREIVERFAFIGDTPLGMIQVEEPSIKDDNKLFDSVDVERLDIAELEDLATQMMARAEYLRGQTPPVPSPAPDSERHASLDSPKDDK